MPATFRIATLGRINKADIFKAIAASILRHKYVMKFSSLNTRSSLNRKRKETTEQLEQGSGNTKINSSAEESKVRTVYNIFSALAILTLLAGR